MVSLVSSHQPSTEPSSSFNLARRSEELMEKIQFFHSAIAIDKQITFSVGPFNSGITAKLKENVLQVPSWFLFRYEDIPPQFQIAGLNDPRIDDEEFLNGFADWMNGTLGEAGLTAVCRPVDFEILQKVLGYLRNRENYTKLKEFLIGHGMAHFLFELQREQERQKECEFFYKIAGSCVGGFIFYVVSMTLAHVMLPFMAVGVTLFLGGVYVTIAGGTLIAMYLSMTGKMPTLSEIVQEEKSADLKAANILQDAHGGIYYFESTRMHNLLRRYSINSSHHPEIDAEGNNLEDAGHPPLTERVALLYAWQAQHNYRRMLSRSRV